MGSLYLAKDPAIDRLVVVKTLERACSPAQKQRFIREARASGRLSHPNVVSVFDVGEQDRTPFIVMEYIDGDTLATIIRDRQPIPFRRRLDFVDQLCVGLAYAHDQGVVHRDIKPSNLMLDKAGTLRILDFGIARLDPHDHTTTSSGVIGTPNYMSPEQWEGGVIERRSDVFSVGAVVYELFSFTKAFPGSTPPAVVRAMFGDGPQPLRAICPRVPREFAEIVERMLARRPEDRYDSLHAVREALRRVRAQVNAVDEQPGNETVPVEPPEPSRAPQGRPGVHFLRGRWWP